MWSMYIVCMMTSSNGSIFLVTGHLCGHRWIPRIQRPVTRSFDVFFDLRLNIRLSKQSWGWWFETPSRPLWRHCSVYDVGRHHSGEYHWTFWLAECVLPDWYTIFQVSFCMWFKLVADVIFHFCRAFAHFLMIFRYNNFRVFAFWNSSVFYRDAFSYHWTAFTAFKDVKRSYFAH